MSVAETLLDVFMPPEGMVGHSAALVAMTGAEDFLEEAVKRFTGLGPRQRAELGNVHVYLMLDGHASSSRQNVFPPGRIPSLHEFHPRVVAPDSLLHAKLALLAFAPNRTAEPGYLRLAILTANFTYASAKQQLELVWIIDVPLDQIAPAADRAEVAAAGMFVRQLLNIRFHHDEYTLPSKQRRLTARLERLLATAAAIAPARRSPRFIHSLDRPLYEQIQQRFCNAISSPRNLLLCGSGFYEEPSNKAQKPTVFEQLENLGVFTGNVRRVALVEPDAAGAVAPWAMQGKTEGWEIVRPTDANGFGRSLHAKFVYVGYLRDGHVSNGWLYLGSGNLSRRGLLTSSGMPKGNVEVGIVFAIPDRLDGEKIKHSLFWDPDGGSVDASDWTVGQMGDGPETQTLLEAPPILSASLGRPPERGLRLFWREDVPSDARVSVRWTGGEWLSVKRDQRVALHETDAPSALHVRDERLAREWLVPIVDPAGRVCWHPPRFTTYADAISALLDFPIRPSATAARSCLYRRS